MSRPAARGKPGTAKFLARAAEALGRAEALCAAGAFDRAAGRAYYAMLYAAKALLNERGLRLQSHAAVAAALRTACVDRGLLDAEYHDAWCEALARRRAAEAGEALLAGDAEDLVERARGFVAAAARGIDRGRAAD